MADIWIKIEIILSNGAKMSESWNKSAYTRKKAIEALTEFEDRMLER